MSAAGPGEPGLVGLGDQNRPLAAQPARPGEPVLSIRGLEVSFPSEAGQVRAVRGLDLDVRAGETLAVLGESGCGKSVTALAVMGLLPAAARTAGSIRLEGTELLGRPDAELAKIRGRRVAMIFQDALASLTPALAVGDQLIEAVQAHSGLGRAAARRRAAELLELVGVPDPVLRLGSYPFELSGGLGQRVLIAMAIANQPAVIIADECTTALDATVQAQVLTVLADAQRETGASILLITHDLGVVAGQADRVSVLYAGRQVELGPVREVFERPRMPYTIGLLASAPRVDRPATSGLAMIEGSPPDAVRLPSGCPFRPRCPAAQAQCAQSEPELSRVADPEHLAACHRLAEVAWQGPGELFPVPEFPPAVTRPGPPEVLLSAWQLRREFPVRSGQFRKRTVGTIHAVDGVDLELFAGETLALVGESGSGKTSTLFEILDLAPGGGGELRVLGQDAAKLGRKGRRRLRRDLQVVFQNPAASLDPRMPVFDILAEPLRAFGVPSSTIERRVPELMHLVGLDLDQLSRFPMQFSGGQQQRIAIARALALEPRILLLDEPVAALDVSIQAGVVNLLLELQRRLGLSYLLVGHDLAVVRQLADRVAVMCLGSIVETGAVDRVYLRPAHPYTEALLSAMPIPDPAVERQRQRIVLVGEVPSPVSRPVGCKFQGRCPRYRRLSEAEQARCREVQPPLSGSDPVQLVACHFPNAEPSPPAS